MLAKTYIHISDLVMKSAKTLEERLADLLKVNGGKEIFNLNEVQIYDIHNSNGFSGHNYWVDNILIGQLHIATLTSGSYTLYKRIFLENEITEVYDYFDVNGNFTYSSQSLDCPVVNYDSINMEPKSPVINHLYNILYNEYNKARTGNSLTQRIVLLENILKAFALNPELSLSVSNGSQDLAIKNIENEMFRIEADPVLNWTERQDIFVSLKEIRSKIIETKKRVHHLSILSYVIPILFNDILIKFKLIRKRPISNIKGISYKWSFGKIFWFLGTVKENLGYSVALAIYGPFTFYFITQPMNPHAMWAVGKVRNAYISAVQSVEPAAQAETVQLIAETKKIQDSVSTGQASIEKTENTVIPQATSSLPEISWDDRMSNFKAMQIAYEGNMVFAARMGRLEQMETHFSFPLTAESAWQETQRYIRSVKGTLQYNTNLDARYKNFLTKEIARAENLQVYIWKKMSQFFLDHPFISVDQSNEQKQRDFYVGRAFIFMDEMTQELSKRDLKDKPHTHKKVSALAKFYRQSRVHSTSIMDDLKNNSKLFRQADIFNTKEFRSYMKDHWEVLFLQQNKKQEASSFGLQTYTWSIKNAIWTMQSIYSAKREELNTLTYKFNLNNQNTSKVASDKSLDSLLESMMHMLTIEYVSIKQEFSNNLKYDEEAKLRENIINNVKDYLVERDKLFSTTMQVANTSSRASTQI